MYCTKCGSKLSDRAKFCGCYSYDAGKVSRVSSTIDYDAKAGYANHTSDISIAYDGDKLVSATMDYGDSSSTTFFEYDERGNCIRQTNDRSSCEYVYDEHGNLVSETLDYDDGQTTTVYTYKQIRVKRTDAGSDPPANSSTNPNPIKDYLMR